MAPNGWQIFILALFLECIQKVNMLSSKLDVQSECIQLRASPPVKGPAKNSEFHLYLTFAVHNAMSPTVLLYPFLFVLTAVLK